MPDRFDDFTEYLRQSLIKAQESAMHLKRSNIEPEDLLIGTIQEGYARQILEFFGVDFERLTKLTNEYPSRSVLKPYIEERFGLSDEAKQAIELTVEESEKLRKKYIGTEHLLLALLRMEQSAPYEILTYLSISYDQVNAYIANSEAYRTTTFEKKS